MNCSSGIASGSMALHPDVVVEPVDAVQVVRLEPGDLVHPDPQPEPLRVLRRDQLDPPQRSHVDRQQQERGDGDGDAGRAAHESARGSRRGRTRASMSPSGRASLGSVLGGLVLARLVLARLMLAQRTIARAVPLERHLRPLRRHPDVALHLLVQRRAEVGAVEREHARPGWAPRPACGSGPASSAARSCWRPAPRSRGARPSPAPGW